MTHPPIRMAAFAAALLLAARIDAQTGTPSDSARAKTGKAQIVGVVLDSVNGGFLAGATILLDPSQKNAETDSAGRFVFDSLAPGTFQIGVFHPLLDAIDMSIATKPFHAGPDSASVAILAVPSPATIVLSRCGNQKRETGASAIFGHVTDPETLQPVVGAEVSVAWTEIEVSKSFGIRDTPHVVRDTTNAGGAYRLCGLPSQLEATLKAQRGASATGEIPITLGNRPVEVGTRSLLLSTSDPATRTGSAALTGVVQLEGTPSNLVSRVELVGTDVAAVTDDKGKFTLLNLPSGTRTIVARHLGYAAQAVTVDLNPRETQHVTVKLPKYVAVMDPVLVTARRNIALDKIGFTQRKKSGIGYFLDGDRIERMHATNVSDILRMVPSLRADYNPSNGQQVITNARGVIGLNGNTGCIQYYVDDMPYTEMEGGDINSFITGGEIVAVEVYQPGLAPAQYQKSFGCTAILLWTRFKVRS